MASLEGNPAPDWAAAGHDSKTYALKDFRGKYVILYFYPKADTPG